jgi:DNA polymerase-3 subunit gamma/tau
MLTKEAFNALLKTLEEPPPHVMFIFATTEIYKIPLTILSRCQRFDFRRISIDEIVSRLRFISNEENIKIDDDALLIIAKRADGSMRDAQSLFDQVVSFCGENVKSEQIIPLLNIVDQEIYFRITEIVKQKDIKAGLLLVDEIISRGYDLRDFLNGLMEHFRNILLTLATGSTNLIESSEIYKQKYEQIAKHFSETELLRLIKITTDIDSAIRWNQQPRLKLEMGLVQMIKLDNAVEITKLLNEIDELKKNLNGSTGEIFADSKNIKDTTSAPIKGNVKATPPTLRADQIADLKSNVSDSSTSYRINDPPKNTTMQASDIVGKWSALIQEVKKERMDLGTMLGDSALLEVDDDRLCIGCPDGFHLEALSSKRNYYYLQKLVEKVYGFKLRLETKISTTMTTQPSDPDKQSNALQNQTKSEVKQHPVVKALIKEFGAREIK